MFLTSLRLGVPTSIQQCSVGLGMVLMQRLINSFGVDTISAITAAMKLESFAMVPIMMFYMGLSNFTGQNIGAGKLDRIHRGYRQTMVMSMITCAGIILLLIFAGPYAIRLYNMNEAATAIGVEYLQTLAWFFLIFCVMYITNGVLQGQRRCGLPHRRQYNQSGNSGHHRQCNGYVSVHWLPEHFLFHPRGLGLRYRHCIDSISIGQVEA